MAKTLGTPWQKLGHEVPASELEGVDLYWRASNYLSVGQIYLRSNPLMRADFVDEKTGETVEKNISASEMNKRRLEYARQLDAERYKDERTVPLSELNKKEEE